MKDNKTPVESNILPQSGIEALKTPLSEKRSQALNPFKKIYNYVFSDKTKQTYTLLTCTFAFISILIIFAIFPTVNSITQIAAKIEEYKVVKTKQQEKINAIYQLQLLASNSIENGGIKPHIDFLQDIFFPNKINEEDIFKDIINRAKDNNVNLQSIKTQEKLPVAGIEKVQSQKFQLTLLSKDKGKIEDVIKSIISAKHLYTIQKYNLTIPTAIIRDLKNDTSDENNSYSAQIILLAYFYE